MKRNLLFLILISLFFACSQEEEKNNNQAAEEPEINSFEKLNEKIRDGWNTFDNRSIMNHVLLPEGLAVHLKIHDSINGNKLGLAFTGNRVPGSEKVRTIAHTPDGSYTDFRMTWQEFGLQVQSATQDEHLYLLITPDQSIKNPGTISISSYMIYGNKGEITKENDYLLAKLPEKEIKIYRKGDIKSIPDSSFLEIGLTKQSIITTDESADLQKVKQLIEKRKTAYENEKAKYGDLADVYNVIQNSMNWLVVYDPDKDRLVTPVSRPWSFGWGGSKPGGFVLFCWDNFFGAYMHSLASKELAYNEAIQMCKEIDDLGFVPNYSGPKGIKSRDRSQPPVGSMMVKEIYKNHPEKWFLEEVFDRLLKWNRWWEQNRDWDGYLCWGSNPFDPVLDDKREYTQNEFKAASNESGLDNTPMYDGVEFDTIRHLLPVADVGLMGMYIGDCEALAEIATEIGREEEAKELTNRAEKYRKNLQTFWDEETGIFLNKYIDKQELSHRISPTNFYALIAKAATQQQAERMIKEHFYNPDEFWGEWIMPSIARNDTAYTGMDYWRGSIWAPMNFLVYIGMCNYDLPKAKKDLAEKSKKLLMTEWEKYGYVRENYHAETGTAPPYRSDHFYHWGALLGMINMIENGYVKPIEQPLGK